MPRRLEPVSAEVGTGKSTVSVAGWLITQRLPSVRILSAVEGFIICRFRHQWSLAVFLRGHDASGFAKRGESFVR